MSTRLRYFALSMLIVLGGCVESDIDLSKSFKSVMPISAGLYYTEDLAPYEFNTGDRSLIRVTNDGNSYYVGLRGSKSRTFVLSMPVSTSVFLVEMVHHVEKDNQDEFIYCFATLGPREGQFTIHYVTGDALTEDLQKIVASPSKYGASVLGAAKTTFLFNEVVRRRLEFSDRAIHQIYSPVAGSLDGTYGQLNAGGQAAKPQNRVALVIANSAYSTVGDLQNPTGDAKAIASALRDSGFNSVDLKNNLKRDEFLSTLRDFARKVANADWGVVYYAGHGMRAGGTDYLIPVDAQLASDKDVQFEAVDLNQVIAAVDGAKKIRIVILDACRDNPFVKKLPSTLASRSIVRGLAPPPETNTGTMVVFAAKEGQQSQDGDGEHSPFVAALLREMAKPHLEVRRLFDLVRDDVMDATKNKQQPFTYGSLSGREEFYFVP